MMPRISCVPWGTASTTEGANGWGKKNMVNCQTMIMIIPKETFLFSLKFLSSKKSAAAIFSVFQLSIHQGSKEAHKMARGSFDGGRIYPE